MKEGPEGGGGFVEGCMVHKAAWHCTEHSNSSHVRTYTLSRTLFHVHSHVNAHIRLDSKKPIYI